MKSIAISQDSKIVQDFIEREQARKMVAMYNSVFVMQLLLGTVFVVVAYNLYEPVYIGLWFFLHQTLLFARKLLIVWHLRNSQTEVLSKPIEHISLFLVACSSLLWGSTAFALDFVQHPQESVFILAITLGIGVGATVLGAVWYRYFYYYLIPFMSLFAIAFIIGVPEPSYLLVAVYIAFALFTLRTVNISYKNTIEHLSLVKENEILVQTTNQFIAAASHDLRQPSQALSLLISALEESHQEVDREKLIVHLKKSSSTLNDLLTNILDVSKLNSETFQPEIRPINLQEIFKLMKSNFTSKAEAKGIEFFVSDFECWVETDPVMMERLFSNLVDNAIRYTNSGSVRIDVDIGENNLVCITVSDTGIGIASDKQAFVFEPFYQISNKERNSNKGFGLGLSIVNRIAHKLSIELELDSIEGKGTTFRLNLFYCEKPVQVLNKEAVSSRWSLRNKRILIIEDNETVLEGLVFQVNVWGMQACIASDAEEALDKIRGTERFDVLLADLRLKNGDNGMDVLETLKNEHKASGTPAIILSGDTAPNVIDEVIDRGFILLHKPTKPAHLRSVIQRCVFTD
ncbi:hybrid sensor histidine kinase/response regulator [Alteromonas flava]|uniref:ATP-binding response regulator n=1 Tax=Alteromonas flava TaxID=2048003 RepID=UPI000C293C2E|nr:hybrid sensor histidine kinase/response regulator [Alteromonas flava]